MRQVHLSLSAKIQLREYEMAQVTVGFTEPFVVQDGDQTLQRKEAVDVLFKDAEAVLLSKLKRFAKHLKER